MNLSVAMAMTVLAGEWTLWPFQFSPQTHIRHCNVVFKVTDTKKNDCCNVECVFEEKNGMATKSAHPCIIAHCEGV